MSNQALGSKKWKDIRLRVLARDGYVCTYCGTHLEGGNATVDHITSRKVGGDIWDMDNLTSACKPCNSRKGSRFFNRVSTPLSLKTVLSLRRRSHDHRRRLKSHDGRTKTESSQRKPHQARGKEKTAIR